MQGMQSTRFKLPEAFENVPGGHPVGVATPSGQYVPTGQGPEPVCLEEPFGQKKPAAQKPEGLSKLVLSQYSPAGHMSHSASLVNPSRAP